MNGIETEIDEKTRARVGAHRIELSRSTARPFTPRRWPPGEEFGSSRTAVVDEDD